MIGVVEKTQFMNEVGGWGEHVMRIGGKIKYFDENCLGCGEFVFEVGGGGIRVETANCLEIGLGADGVFVVVDDLDHVVVIVENDSGIEEIEIRLGFDEQSVIGLIIKLVLNVMVNGGVVEEVA